MKIIGMAAVLLFVAAIFAACLLASTHALAEVARQSEVEEEKKP